MTRAKPKSKPKPSPEVDEIQLAISHRRGKPWRAPLDGLARQFLAALALEGVELSISLVTDAAIRRINREWRAKDKATDVLSFPAGETPEGAPGPRPLGDVIISLDTTERVAKEEGREVRGELARYLAHGLLHLLGHDHQKPAETRRMQALEARLLGGEGLIPTLHPAPAPARKRRPGPSSRPARRRADRP